MSDSKINLVYIALSILTARVITKLIVTYTHSGNIILTKNGISKSIKSFMKTETNQSTQL